MCPGPPHFSVLQATKSWVGHGNKGVGHGDKGVGHGDKGVGHGNKATQDVAVLNHTASDRKLGEGLGMRVH